MAKKIEARVKFTLGILAAVIVVAVVFATNTSLFTGSVGTIGRAPSTPNPSARDCQTIADWEAQGVLTQNLNSNSRNFSPAAYAQCVQMYPRLFFGANMTEAQCRLFAGYLGYGYQGARTNITAINTCQSLYPILWAQALYMTGPQCHQLAVWLSQGVLTQNVQSAGLNAYLPAACAQTYYLFWGNVVNPSYDDCKLYEHWWQQGTLYQNIQNVRNGQRALYECEVLYPSFFSNYTGPPSVISPPAPTPPTPPATLPTASPMMGPRIP